MGYVELYCIAIENNLIFVVVKYLSGGEGGGRGRERKLEEIRKGKRVKERENQR